MGFRSKFTVGILSFHHGAHRGMGGISLELGFSAFVHLKWNVVRSAGGVQKKITRRQQFFFTFTMLVILHYGVQNLLRFSFASLLNVC